MKTKKIWVSLALGLAIATLGVTLKTNNVNATATWPGLGTAESPYRISNCSQLQAMGSNLSAHYMLSGDIDCTMTSGWNAPIGFLPVGNSLTPFTGSLDGRYHSISGLTINNPGSSYNGLFGVTNAATIKNVGLTEANISGDIGNGALIGSQFGGTTDHSFASDVSISGQTYSGGLVGMLTTSDGPDDRGVVNASWTSGTVNNYTFGLGGLVGYVDNGIITNSYSTASVANNPQNSTYVGGLVGYVGYNSIIRNNYSTGSNTGSTTIGGLAGLITDNSQSNTIVANNFSVSQVTSTDASYGAFVGILSDINMTNVTNNYYDSHTTAVINCDVSFTVLVGRCEEVNGDGNDNDHFKNTTSVHPFDNGGDDGWDFTNVWQTNADGFPTLRPTTLDTIVDLTTPGYVSITDVSGNEDTITATWEAPEDTGGDIIDHYNVSISPSGVDSWTTVQTTDTAYAFEELDPGTLYDVKITAVNSVGEGSITIESEVITVEHDINTCQQLQNIKYSPDEDYSIATDTVDCSMSSGWNEGDGFEPIEDFTGLLAGNGRVIDGLTINRPNDWGNGLFYSMSDGASVTNLTMNNLSITGYGECGGLVGYPTGNVSTNGLSINGDISCSHTAGSVMGYAEIVDSSTINMQFTYGNVTFSTSNDEDGEYWGGLIGWAEISGGGTVNITNSATVLNQEDNTSNAAISGGMIAKAYVASNSAINITGVDSTGMLETGGPVGGIIGQYIGSWSGSEEDVRPQISIVGSSSGTTLLGSADIGGLVGDFDANGSILDISDSYCDCSLSVTDTDNIGGLVGNAHTTTTGTLSISSSHALGDYFNINGINTGGLVGRADIEVDIIESYANVSLTSNNNTGGLVGFHDGGNLQILTSYAAGNINSLDNIGGIVGYEVQYVQITNSYSHFDITGGYNVGGLVGIMTNGFINKSYAAGSITTDQDFNGGLVSVMYSGSITHSFAGEQFFGNVNKSGAIGLYADDNITLEDVLYDRDLVGSDDCAVSLLDVHVNDETCSYVNAEGSDPTYFQINSSNHPFDTGNWDFTETWGITNTYPVLRFHPESEILEAVYDITNCEQLQNMRLNLEGEYTLVNDIDCYDTSGWNDGAGFAPVGTQAHPFTGSLNGDNHTINGLNINRPSAINVGLFGSIENGTVSDLNIYGEASIVGGVDVGLLAGRMHGGTVTNVSGYEYVGGEQAIGGLIGFAYCASNSNNITLNNLKNSSYVVSSQNIYGGIVGLTDIYSGCTATINNAYNDGFITNEAESNSNMAGGIVGEVNSGSGTLTIKNSTNDAIVAAYDYAAGGIIGMQLVDSDTGTPVELNDVVSNGYISVGTDGQSAGGLIGYSQGSTNISKSYVTNTIEGASDIGGLVGQIYSKRNDLDISQSYNMATINILSSGTQAGGLVGYGEQVAIENSYNTGNIIANDSANVGGIAGELEGSVINSYSVASVAAGNYVGGFIGNYHGDPSDANLGLSNNFAVTTDLSSADSWTTAGFVGHESDTGLPDLHNNHFYNSSEEFDCVRDSDNAAYTQTDCQSLNDQSSLKTTNDNQPLTHWDFDNIWTTKTDDFPQLQWHYVAPATTITNCQQLQAIKNNLSGDYAIGQNIDCSDSINWNGGKGFTPIGDNFTPFTGSLNGNEFNITNLYINAFSTQGSSSIGLFGYAQNATITRINVHNDSDYIISGYNYVGGLVGGLSGSTLSDSTFDGLVLGKDGSYVGGAVGYVGCIDSNQNTTISSVETYGDLNFNYRPYTSYIGGIIGYAEASEPDCVLTMDMLYTGMEIGYTGGDQFGGSEVGGLVGEIDQFDGGLGSLTNSHAGAEIENALQYAGGAVGYIYTSSDSDTPFNVDAVTSNSAVISAPDESNEHDGCIGGLVGYGDKVSIKNSSADSLVVGSHYLGGLVGCYNGDGGTASIEQSYSTGPIIDSNGTQGGIGGLVGWATGGAVIKNSYSESEINTDSYNVGGLAGYLMGDIINSYASGAIISESAGYDIGGLVGWYNGSTTTNEDGILDSFSVTNFEMDHDGMPTFGGIIGIDSGPANNVASNHYDYDLADTNVCEWLYGEGPSIGVSCTDVNAEDMLNTDNDGPLENWDFTNIWSTNVENYPQLQQKIDPQIQCEQAMATATTVHVSCGVYPDTWGTTTWEMQWRPLTSDTWTDVTLSDSHEAVATITGLSPETWYDVQFRFTNSWGTSDWGYQEIHTLAGSDDNSGGSDDAGSSGGSGSSSPTTSTTTKKKAVTVSDQSNDTTETPEQKIILNDFNDYFSDGVSLDLHVGQIIYFNVGGQEHTATVLEIGVDYVVIQLKSTPQTVRLNIGQTGDYDVTDDSQNDIEISLQKITNGLASLRFKNLYHDASLAAAQNDSGAAKISPKHNTLYLWLGLGTILLVVVLAKKRRKDHEKQG